MKVSASAPFESQGRSTGLTRPLAAAVLVAYGALHFAFLAPSLEDIDSINFALGLRDFDVAQHQPHPPGYPVYMVMGRVTQAALQGVGVEGIRAETLALALWSAVAAPIAVAAAFGVYRAATARAALPAAALLAAAPLFWISALRPMSDMPGLAVALVAQALLVRAIRDPGVILPGAFVAGLAAGIRVQSIWLTAPVLLVVLYRRRHDAFGWALSRAFAAGLVGVLVWAIPLVIASGGLDRYLAALGSQAGEDLTVIDILWSNPTPRRLAFSLYETFVMPWGSIPLAVAVLVMAVAGIVVTAVRDWRALAMMAFLFTPYLVFHLLFQETAHVRYALPALVPIAWLAAQGVERLGRAASAAHVALVVVAAAVSVAGARAYSSEAHPVFRAVADMSRAASAERPAAVYSHYSIRRPLQAWSPAGVNVVEPPRSSEWKEMIDYWRSGGSESVWFLADSRRTDLALIDPRSRTAVTSYHWRAGDRFELSGVRPRDVDWYRLEPPEWFAGEGWSLTPELGGVTRASRTGIDYRPLEAMVRRRPDRMVGVIGARHLGTGADGGAVFTLALDGREVDRWELDPSRGANVIRVVDLPPGSLAGEGPYARVTIAAQPLNPGAPVPPVAVRQFDVQPASGLVHAFDEGWHEEEYDNATGVRWRWTSDRSVIRILPVQDVRLRIRGESPLTYFDSPPLVSITAGRVIAELRPDGDFDWTVTIPARDVGAAGGRISIETDQVYLPAVAEGSSDERRLGLRLFEIDVDQVLP